MTVRPTLVAVAAALLAVALPGCGPRAVEVSTGESRPAESSIDFTNNLSQAVNVYVRPASGSEVFLRQVGARSTESIPVRGISAGSSVTLRAAPVDGSTSYSREGVTLGRGVAWRVP
ncbi:hypothetical protein [Roseisolibacter sp. H3M3-2]|uniref:hypothetical protein n=1 Tax=Roseisolibacter sp. H3M3-2 TaxID=3031323 RepID=UPI0023DA45B7|nr:hypothetical protein [Roseisolibacter sp. H3M3-2]MDF1502990.1 hypothetical protein [Roseisolibacter sp. H3M3-2]